MNRSYSYGNAYEYYYFGDCWCVVGTTYSFEDKDSMIEWLGNNGVEIECPDDASVDGLYW